MKKSFAVICLVASLELVLLGICCTNLVPARSTTAAQQQVDTTPPALVQGEHQLPVKGMAALQTELPYTELPKEVQGEVGDFIAVTAKTNGAEVWWLVTDPSLKLFPPQLLKDSKSIVMVARKNGKYPVYAWTAVGGKSHPATVCWVIVGPPTPGPGPGPDPGPGPGPGPTPGPAPIPAAGLRVLMVFETAEATKLPPAQQAILYGAEMRAMLNSKCTVGADGKTKEWRIYDKDLSMANESKLWQDAMARPRTTVPWIIVSNGTDGYEGPLPATVDEAKKLVEKFAK